jgi:predicted O-methyltransferase YrrM
MLTFPETKPDVPHDIHGWFSNNNKEFLKPLIVNVKVIIELGAWLGSSTRWFCDNSSAHVYSVDHWEGSFEHQARKGLQNKLPILYKTFIVNCWNYKNRITPVKMNTIAGMTYLFENDIKPDIIFVDASHEFEDVLADLQTASRLFPSAVLVGDDWTWRNRRFDKRNTVREAVLTFCKQNNFKISHNNRCWRIKK